MIRVNVDAQLSGQGGSPLTGDMVEASISQCVADAVEGSFDEYPKQMHPKLRLRAVRLGDDSVVRRGDHFEVRFSMGLPDDLFPLEQGGLQLLVNLLAGDIFPTASLGCRWDDVHVTSLDLGSHLRAEADRLYRSKSFDIDSIRDAFNLGVGEPLLAFSLKPRVGLTFAEVKATTLEVLRAGFNVVELDSRNLALSTDPLDAWIDLGQEAAAIGAHITAFSPNFSGPAGLVAEVSDRWVREVGTHGPAVMKIDGGLDGLSDLQAIRGNQVVGAPKPMITSYPILRNQLASAVGSGGWVELLEILGADIIYPGGRPTFPNERRPVWGSHADDWARAGRIYDRYLKQGWPMPTVAGGIHPGHLQACYELLGPNVAYFLGGAVALHPKGVKEGATLCVRVLRKAIDLSMEAEQNGDDFADDLPGSILRAVERVKYPRTELNYFSPANIFRRSEEVQTPPDAWYRR